MAGKQTNNQEELKVKANPKDLVRETDVPLGVRNAGQKAEGSRRYWLTLKLTLQLKSTSLRKEIFVFFELRLKWEKETFQWFSLEKV